MAEAALAEADFMVVGFVEVSRAEVGTAVVGAAVTFSLGVGSRGVGSSWDPASVVDGAGTVGTEENRASALEVHLGMRVGKGGGE